jgi:hypothetical protein
LLLQSRHTPTAAAAAAASRRRLLGVDLLQLLLQRGQRLVAPCEGLPQLDNVCLCRCAGRIGCVKELLYALLCCCHCLCYCCLKLCLDGFMRYSLKGGGEGRGSVDYTC